MLENEILKRAENRGKKLRGYKSYLKDTYEYRVDEILDDINKNDFNFKEIEDKGELLYNEIKEMLGEKGQHLLIKYVDTEIEKRSYEEYTLAKQIYEDLKER